jgi:hypothetical protein
LVAVIIRAQEDAVTNKIRILFLSANPLTTSRILVDEEIREIFERIHEGPYRDRFELYQHLAARPIDLQKLLLLHQPHIVHFSGHGSRKHQLVLSGESGRGQLVEPRALVNVFGLYKDHVRLVLLNACFTNPQARSLAEVINYSIGTAREIGDRACVTFAGAFYRALGFGKSVRDSFLSAKAELALSKVRRSRGIELFIRQGVSDNDPFPELGRDRF